MKIKKVIDSIGCKIEKQDVYWFRDEEYPCISFKRLKDNPRLKYKVISEYFVIELSDELLQKLFNGSSIEQFRDFQQKLLSKPFFMHKTDLRWNMYLLFIVESYDLLTQVPVDEIESDENYARKYFLSLDDAGKYFEKVTFFSKESMGDTDIIDSPVHKWIELLNGVKLTGCLNAKYSSAVLEDYIINDIAFQDESLCSGDEVDVARGQVCSAAIPERIIEINMGKFREHCFKENVIYPAHINLLHGANGCGKTSIVETVELAITNEIACLNDFKEDSKALPVVSIVCESGGESIQYSSNKNLMQCKELDKLWYGVPIGSERKSTLNYSFNTFNNFEAHSGYRFAKQQCESTEEDEKSLLNNIVFNDRILDMEKKWQKFHEEFIKYLKRIVTEREKIVKEINEEEKQINEQSYSWDSGYNELQSLLRSINFNLETVSNSLGVLQYSQAIFDILQTAQSSISFLSDNYSFAIPLTYTNIYNSKQKAEIRLYEVEERLKRIFVTKIEINEKSSNLNKEIQMLNVSIRKNSNGIDYCKNTIEEWKAYKNIITNVEKQETLTRIKEHLKKIYIEYEVIQRIKRQYPLLEDVTCVDVTGWKNKSIKENRSKLDELNKRRNSLRSALDAISKQLDEIIELKVKIKALGNEYIKLEKYDFSCPLCGKFYSSIAELSESIDVKERKNSDEIKAVVELQSQIISIEKEILTLENDIKGLEKRKEQFVQLLNVFDQLCEIGLLNMEFPCEVEKMLEDVEQVLSKGGNIQKEIDILESEMKSLEKEGYTDENILKGNTFKEINRLYIKFKQETDSDISMFNDFIIRAQNDLIEKVRLDEESLRDRQEQKNNFEDELKNIINQSEELKSNELEIKNQIVLSEKLLLNYQNLLKYFDLNNNQDINKWVIEFADCKVRCGILVHRLKSDFLINEKKVKVKELKTQLEKIDEHKKRCQKALEAFNRMPKLEEYVDKFLENNIDSINYFFRSIHRPKEFIKLDIGEKGLVAIRKSDSELVKAHQMSTGQRVSLALAVLFSRHLSASNAPRFLIMDEPVANMDDLHLLNLVDILREIALNGTQIFFTTANPDVAGIFRRKFSFFGSEFRNFELRRKGAGLTEINVIEYSPDEEVGKLVSENAG